MDSIKYASSHKARPEKKKCNLETEAWSRSYVRSLPPGASGGEKNSKGGSRPRGNGLGLAIAAIAWGIGGIGARI
ncbi:MAG: hypothetical protein Fur0042_21420 [Cyanophyceae cyanobacterium]